MGTNQLNEETPGYGADEIADDVDDVENAEMQQRLKDLARENQAEAAQGARCGICRIEPQETSQWNEQQNVEQDRGAVVADLIPYTQWIEVVSADSWTFEHHDDDEDQTIVCKKSVDIRLKDMFAQELICEQCHQ
nr:hypothetical protein [Bifidobacterium santillanense]